MSDILEESLPKPDLLVYLHREVWDLLPKINGEDGRNRANEANITSEYLSDIEMAYFKYCERMRNQPILIIDITGMNFVKDEDHYKKILHVIDQDYPPGVTYIKDQSMLELKVA